MPDASPLDPIAAWRDFVVQLERTVNQTANSAMASESYREAMHRMLLGGVVTHEAGHEAMRRLFQALDLPTRDDIAVLGERLRSIEAQLLQVAAILEASHPEAAAAVRRPLPSPPRTRKPPVAAASQSEAPAPGPAAPSAPARAVPVAAPPPARARRAASRGGAR